MNRKDPLGMKKFLGRMRSYLKWKFKRIKSYARWKLNQIRGVDAQAVTSANVSKPVPPPRPTRQCIACGKSVHEFIPLNYDSELLRNHHVIGGGISPNCICPSCESYDRHRWIYYVLKNKLNLFDVPGRTLYFAPEKVCSQHMRNDKGMDWYTCDLVAWRAMHIVDITDIQFRDNTFDYIVCNHVLEHIPDEQKAVSEVLRVLKPDGKWIFSFPICTDMKTFEDDTVVSEEDRLQKFGQEDHVRLYGYDYKERFEAYGLNLETFSPQDELSAEEIDKYGLIPDDVIIVATKRQP